jgi:hypothetical protein
MPYPDLTGVIEYHIENVGDPGLYVSTVGVALDADLDTGDMEAIAAGFTSFLTPELSSAYVFQGITARWRNGGVDKEAEESVGDPGGRSGDVLVQNTSILVKKLTGIAGRANRGRNYWPGFLNMDDTNGIGTIDSSRVTALQSAFDDWFDNLATVITNVNNVVIQHADFSAVTVVTSVLVESTCATQRRRLR